MLMWNPTHQYEDLNEEGRAFKKKLVRRSRPVTGVVKVFSCNLVIGWPSLCSDVQGEDSDDEYKMTPDVRSEE